MKTEDVDFFSDGSRIAATLYHPGEGCVPAVVFCQGFGGTREYVAPDLAPRLAGHGIALLAFDHRGFGGSEGAPNQIIPADQIEDIRSALVYLSTREDLDPERLGLLGISFGGAMAIAAAAVEELVRATVVCVPFADGRAWMRDIRRYWEFVEFCRRLERDRIEQVLTGRSEEVDPDEILIRDQESVEWNEWLKANYPSRKGFRLSLASARALLEFRPLDAAPAVARLLVVTVDDDTLIPSDQAIAIYQAAPEPKALHVVRDATHHAIYREPKVDEVADLAGRWFASHLGGE